MRPFEEYIDIIQEVDADLRNGVRRSMVTEALIASSGEILNALNEVVTTASEQVEWEFRNNPHLPGNRKVAEKLERAAMLVRDRYAELLGRRA